MELELSTDQTEYGEPIAVIGSGSITWSLEKQQAELLKETLETLADGLDCVEFEGRPGGYHDSGNWIVEREGIKLKLSITEGVRLHNFLAEFIAGEPIADIYGFLD